MRLKFILKNLFNIALIFVIIPQGLVGCTIPLDIYLVNNSDRKITIAFNVDTYGRESKRYKIEEDEVFKGGARKGDTITIYMGDEILNYEGETIPQEYIEFEGIIVLERIARMQLEPDGKIYILKPDSSIPAKEFSSQPPGYPLVPEVSKNPDIPEEKKES